MREISLKRDLIDDIDRYPFTIPAARKLDGLEFSPTVTFLVGENGSGKSTLLEAIAVVMGFNAEGGTRNFDFGTRASHSVLPEALSLVRSYKQPKDGFFLRAESFFNVQQSSQFIIATHSPILMAYTDALIYHLDENGLSQVAYQDTERYAVTRAFLGNPERMLQEVFDEY